MKTTDQFIDEVKKIHENKYDYSETYYTTKETPVTIICPYHGKFKQRPSVHLKGSGCPECGGYIKKDTSNFIEQSRKIHGDRYDYSLTSYKDKKTKVEIVCPVHGSFFQRPDSHLRGNGCASCVQRSPYTTETYIARLIEKFGEQFDFSRVTFIDKNQKVEITCPVHGSFLRLPHHVLNSDYCCPHCGNDKSGFKMKESAILYYLEIDNGKAYKIGITNRSVRERYNNSDLSKIKILKEWIFDRGSDAAKKEREILSKYKESLYRGSNLLENGNTELFRKNVLGL